jgi:RNA polymerase-binding protein
MSETSMRGSRLGSLSYETDEHVEPAERQMIRYVCPKGHQTVLPFSAEAEEIPLTWSCRCGDDATVVTRSPKLAEPSERPERHVRTHWDMLLERRSIADLEALLEERLTLMRADDLTERKSA